MDRSCNRPKELFPITNAVDPQSWPNIFAYGKRYCGGIQNGFGWDFSGATNLEELQRKLRSSVMVRRLKAEVLTELPPKRRQVIELENSGRTRALLDEERRLERDHEDRIAEFKGRVELAKVNEDMAGYAEAVQALKEGQQTAFADGARIAHEIALAKVPQTIAYLKELVEDGQKVLGLGRLPEIQLTICLHVVLSSVLR